MPDLKLIAFDPDDLAILSAHLQDAVVKIADMAYLKGEKRFVAIANRFDWERAVKIKGAGGFERRRTALRFERVLAARLQRIDLRAKSQVLSLLAIQFEPGDPPGGQVTLVFAGGSAVRLSVECIEAELKDLGAAWKARRRPQHPDEDTSPST